MELIKSLGDTVHGSYSDLLDVEVSINIDNLILSSKHIPGIDIELLETSL